MSSDTPVCQEFPKFMINSAKFPPDENALWKFSLNQLIYYQDNYPNWEQKYKNTLCWELLTGPMSLGHEFRITIANSTGISRYRLDDHPANKSHMLDLIECFKYAIEHGYPYHYNNPTYLEVPYNFCYDTLNSILELFYIDSAEVTQFIVYYFKLFPEMNEDQAVLSFIVSKVITMCLTFYNINTTVLKHIVRSLEEAGVDINATYYDLLFRTIEEYYSGFSYSKNFGLIQAAFDVGIKARPQDISYINHLSRIIYEKTHEYDSGKCIVTTILVMLQELKTIHPSIIDDSIHSFIFTIALTMSSIYCYMSYAITRPEIMQPLIAKLSGYYHNNSPNFEEMTDILIDMVISEIEMMSGVYKGSRTRNVKDDIEYVKTQMRANSNIDPALIDYVDRYATKLATIRPFYIEVDIEQNLYLYKGLDRGKIANCHEWFAAERKDAHRSNTVKLNHIVAQRIKDHGEHQRYANVLQLKEEILKYC